MQIRKSILCAVFLFMGGGGVAAAQQQPEPVNSCISCHLEVGDEMAAPVHGMESDIHAQKGLSCVDCHGGDAKAGLDGDMEAAMNPAKGYIGTPAKKDIPKFCARCHSNPQYMRNYNPRVATDQYDRYQTSVHGKRLAQGDEKVATCIDCHSVHGIRAVNDPRAQVYPLNIPSTCGRCHSDADYMRSYGIPTDQVEKYQHSVHGIALLEKGDQAAPVCNDCHGNHGAAPPGVPAIAFVCGQCHLNNSELFRQSPHNAAFEEQGLPECETCHGNHAIEHPLDANLGIGTESICVSCHDVGSMGYQVAATLYNDIDSLKIRIATADSVIDKATRAGMEVSEARFQLNEANDYLIKARTAVHALSPPLLENQTGAGIKLTDVVLEAGLAALAEVQYRRTGLAISTIFIALLAFGIYLKIKEVDKHTIATEQAKE